MKCLAVIPARGGSRRIPGKNVRRFMGKPILAYSIEAAIESRLFEAVLVSTDDPNIAVTAVLHGAMVAMRPADLSRDEVGTFEVARHAMLWGEATGGLRAAFDAICCVYATAPLMRVFDLERGYGALCAPGCAHAFSVGTNPLQDAGQFYWSHAWALRERVPYVGPNTTMIAIPAEHVCDINTEADWARAEQMYTAIHGATA